MKASVVRPGMRTPHIALHVELMDWSPGPSASWSEWRHLRGGGFRSWLRWVWSMGDITKNEGHQLLAEKYEQRRECHEYQHILRCYCDETFESREWDRQYRAALESLI